MSPPFDIGGPTVPNRMSERRGALILQPYMPKAWGEVFEVCERPMRPFRAQQLHVHNGAEFIIESFRCGTEEMLIHEALAALIQLGTFMAPMVNPSVGFELRVRAEKAKRARPWLRGTRAERKRLRVTWWHNEARRAPEAFQASIIGVMLLP